MGLFNAKTRAIQPLGVDLPAVTIIFDEQDAWSEPQRQLQSQYTDNRLLG